jgi:large subunit ribosomal protein L17
MRHLKAGRKLNRNATHRIALLRNLTLALIRHERIITTEAKAKALRPFVEKLVTLAKKGTLHARRLVISRLGPPSKAEVRPIDPTKKDDEGDPTLVLTKLFSEIGPRFADRPGGYTRIIKRHERRLGDAGKTAIIEFLRAGEVKQRKAAPAPAPAPRVETPPEPTPPAPQATETPPENPPAS